MRVSHILGLIILYILVCGFSGSSPGLNNITSTGTALNGNNGSFNAWTLTYGGSFPAGEGPNETFLYQNSPTTATGIIGFLDPKSARTFWMGTGGTVSPPNSLAWVEGGKIVEDYNRMFTGWGWWTNAASGSGDYNFNTDCDPTTVIPTNCTGTVPISFNLFGAGAAGGADIKFYSSGTEEAHVAGNNGGLNIGSITAIPINLQINNLTQGVLQGTNAWDLKVYDNSSGNTQVGEWYCNTGGCGLQTSGGEDQRLGANGNTYLTVNHTSGGIEIGDSTDPGAGGLEVNATYKLNGVLLHSKTAPTIVSGFGATSPSVTHNNGTAAFTINVGTGTVTSPGVIGLPTAPNGWDCKCTDLSAPTATVFMTKQTASSASSCTVGNFGDTGSAAGWTASDVLSCTAMPY